MAGNQTASSVRGSIMNVSIIANVAEHCGYDPYLVPASSVPRSVILISSDQSDPKNDDGVKPGEGDVSAASDDMIG